jgi:hypothetical protein
MIAPKAMTNSPESGFSFAEQGRPVLRRCDAGSHLSILFDNL